MNGGLLERFKLVRELGQGAYGTVFEAEDEDRGERIALKRLHRTTPSALAAFKREFRTLSKLTHPNLPHLHELFASGDACYFSMEFVSGGDLRSWIRGSETDLHVQSAPRSVTLTDADAASVGTGAASKSQPLDAASIPRLRLALAQLLDVLAFVHRADLIHCDVKPSNVRVTEDGRVKLLDFGLARTLGEATGSFAGTLAYAAPEQFKGIVTPASDLYALGALAWELLVGHSPFGTGTDAAENKQRRPAPSLRERLPEEHADLASFVDMLLSPDPDVRLRAVAEKARSSEGSASRASIFVGREDVLARVERKAREVADGTSRVLILEGPSGIGKTAVLRAIERRIAIRVPSLKVLSARAGEGEHIPFKMLDGIADGLADLPHIAAKEAFAVLGRAFPVLNVGAPRETEGSYARDDLAGALRGALSAVGPCAVLLDDVQWADGDSERLLRAALAPPEAPPVLLVLAQRPSSTMEHAKLLQEVEKITLGPLAREDVVAFVSSASGGARAVPGAEMDRIAQESQGHPLFVEELLDASGGVSPRSLDEALETRLRSLSDEGRAILEVASLSSEPLETRAVATVANKALGPATRVLDALQRGRFMMRVQGRGGVRYAPYHDRISELVRRSMPEERVVSVHHAYVTKLGDGELSADAMCRHLEGAGMRDEAARYARLAADRARSAMAFDSEAAFCLREISLSTGTKEARRALHLRYADALRRAGRSVDAADELLRLARDASEDEAQHLRARAARLLLAAGELGRGRDLLASLLSRFGDAIPRSDAHLFAALVYERALLAVTLHLHRRGLLPVDRTGHDDARLLSLRALAEGLGMIDSRRVAVFHTRALRLGLRSPDPILRGELLAIEAIFLGSADRRGRERAQELFELAEAGFDGEPAPRVVAFVAAAKAVFERYQRPSTKNLERLKACEAVFEALGEGDAWVLWSLRIVRARGGRLLGNLNEMRSLYYPLIAKAEAQQDVFGTVTLRRGHTLLHLASDRPEEARRTLAKTHWPSDPTTYHSQDWLLLEARLETDLYEGRVPTLTTLEWRRLRKSILHHSDTQRVLHRYMLGRLLLLSLSSGRSGPIARLRQLREVRQLELQLVREREAHALAMARVLRATLAYLDGRLERARGELRALIRIARTHELLSLGANASLILSHLLEGAESEREFVSAAAFYKEHGVRNPRAWARIDFPAMDRVFDAQLPGSSKEKSPRSP